jgi:hypothetical protein
MSTVSLSFSIRNSGENFLELWLIVLTYLVLGLPQLEQIIIIYRVFSLIYVISSLNDSKI